MSLSRAFTTRRARAGSELGDSNLPKRSGTNKGSAPQNLRKQISGPVQLVHTTNMLSYNAPDLPRSNRADSTSKSDTESETVSNADSTPPTSPEATSSEGYPSPKPNHLSSYFIAPGKPGASELEPEVPAIPKRSPSHTKQNSYDALARQRSVSQQRSFSQMSRASDRTVSSNHSQQSATFSRSSSTSTRASTNSQGSAPPVTKAPPMPRASPLSSPHLSQDPAPSRSLTEPHPFGAELAQVTELAEEFSSSRRPHIMDEDDEYLSSNGLMKLSLDDYMNDVQALFDVFYQQPPKRAVPPPRAFQQTATAGWI